MTWTDDALHGFEKLKTMMNACPKLYFINRTYKILLYTDASDYARGAFLYQIRPATETSKDRGSHQVPQWVIQRRSNEIVHNREGSLRHLLGT